MQRGPREMRRLSAAFDRMFARLEKAFDTERQFTSDASHELRTPITVILAECDRAKRKAYTRDDFLESVGVIEQQSEHMSQLVQALLGLTRMEHGTDKYPIKRMDLSALVCSCCEECPPPPGSDAEVELDIQPDIQAACNAGLMSRVVVNLLQNAYKYGGEQVRVRVSLHENADGKAVLRVADDGPGIAPEDQDKVWQRFWQADPSRGEDGRQRARTRHGQGDRAAARRLRWPGEHARKRKHIFRDPVSDQRRGQQKCCPRRSKFLFFCLISFLEFARIMGT